MSDARDVWLEIEVERKRGFVDASGAERVAPRYDFVRQLSEDRVFVRDGAVGAVRDAAGELVFEVDARVVLPFREGRAAFMRQGAWGFLDEAGNVAVEPRFDGVFVGYEDGVVRVSDRSGRQILVDRDGQDVLPDAKEIRQSPRAGVVPFMSAKKKWGLYSVRRREVVVEPAYAQIFGAHGEHWILQKAAKKWGAADAAGAITIEPTLPWLGSICEGRGATRNVAGAVGFVDPSGALVVEHRFESRGTQDDMSFFADGRCAVQVGSKIGFVDRDGELVVEPRWVNGFHFGEGRGVVVDEGGWTYVDERGEPITERRFQRAETFAGGIGVVTTAEGKGALRRDGAEVVPAGCQSISVADGVLTVQDGSGHRAYYDRHGACIWRHAGFAHELRPDLS